VNELGDCREVICKVMRNGLCSVGTLNTRHPVTVELYLCFRDAVHTPSVVTLRNDDIFVIKQSEHVLLSEVARGSSDEG
jgi:hypothetical protein